MAPRPSSSDSGNRWPYVSIVSAMAACPNLERFGDARLDYILVQWAGRGAVLSAEVIDGRLPGGTWGSDHLAVLAELDLDTLAGKAPDPGG
jgi:endonuclease/exonuclease/phosphatase family metal-dependent hydrolase